MSEDDEKNAEVISFEEASHPHVHARKDAKLNKLKKAFRSVTREHFKSLRAEKRKRKNKKKKKK